MYNEIPRVQIMYLQRFHEKIYSFGTEPNFNSAVKSFDWYLDICFISIFKHLIS